MRTFSVIALTSIVGCVFAAGGALAAANRPSSPVARVSGSAHSGPLSSLLGSVARLLTPKSGCSWRAQYGDGGQTVLETDTDAAYWATSYLALPGSTMTIQGTFPAARNMSFTVYHLSGAAEGGHLYDAQIVPDAGGTNPFQQGQTGTGTYTLQVVSGQTPANPAPNTLYTNTGGGLTEVELVYRVYDPTDPASPQGSVPLPQTTVTRLGTPVQENQPCVGSPPPPAAATATSAVVARRSTATPAASRATVRRARAAAPAPTWVASKILPVFSDPDNEYLSARISQLDGQVVVIQGQMPTFPDTNAGDPPWSPAQVRYWSMCENNGLIHVVVGCSADFNTVQNGDTATFVISTPSNRPANAISADGVNWLPWGSGVDGVVIYRQMLPDPSYTQSIAAADTGSSSPAAAMGPYLPQIAYCSVAEFTAAGAAGCLGSSS